MNKNSIGNIVISLIAISLLVFLFCYIKYNITPKDESAIYNVVCKITVNNIPLNNLQYKETAFLGGSDPYLWDLWKANGLIKYYFVEDLISRRADNYRDVMVGISLLYPCDENNRDYPNNKILNQDMILNACVFTFCEGADAKLIKCDSFIVSDYKGVPDRWEGDKHYNAGETSVLYPGFLYDLKYIPLSVLGISSP